MKIQLTHYNKTYTAEGPDDGDIVSVLEDFKGLLVACGFHPRTVDSHFPHLCTAWWPEEDIDDADPEGSTRNQLTMNFPSDFAGKHDPLDPQHLVVGKQDTFEPQQLSENDEPTNY